MPRTRSAGLKAHLVEAAAQLLDTEGPTTLTTRQIARHAAVSDGVLYNHFADRDELIVSALGSRYAQLLEAFESRLTAVHAGEGSPTPLEALRAWLRLYALGLRDLEADALHLAAGILAEPRLLEAFWIEMHRAPLGIARLRAPLVERLRAAVGAGVLSGAIDVDAAATLVFGATLMSAVTIRVNVRVDRDRVDRDLVSAIDLVTAAAGSNPPPSR